MSLATRPVGRFEWEQILRRMRKDGLIAGSGKTGKDGRPTRGGVAAPTFLAVALVLATYGELGGTEVFPGDAAVAVDCQTTIKTVRAVRSCLIQLGMLTLVAASSRRRGAEWRLSLPVEFPADVVVLTPAQHLLAAKRLRDAARGKRPMADPAGPTQDDDSGSPPDHPNSPSGSPADYPNPEHMGWSVGTPENDLGWSVGTPMGWSAGPAYQTTDLATTDQANSDEDQIADLTVSRAKATSEEPDSSIADLTSRPRCRHGRSTRRRKDGHLRCPDCDTHETSQASEQPPARPLTVAEQARLEAREAIAAAQRKRHPERPQPGQPDRHNHAAAIAAIDHELATQAATRTTETQEQPA